MDIKLTKLEILESDQVIGGFSIALDGAMGFENFAMANNCHAGNCSKSSCKKYKPLPEPVPTSNNCKTNCVTSCGKKH